jgi:hypothetical protein
VVLFTLVFPAVAWVVTDGFDVTCAWVGATTAAVADPGFGFVDEVVAAACVGAVAFTETAVLPTFA